MMLRANKFGPSYKNYINNSFFREDDLPEENDSTNCEALCQSTSSGQVDSCGGLSTHSDHFFVLVTAHAQYSNAVLSFTGDNLQHIENVQSDD